MGTNVPKSMMTAPMVCVSLFNARREPDGGFSGMRQQPVEYGVAWTTGCVEWIATGTGDKETPRSRRQTAEDEECFGAEKRRTGADWVDTGRNFEAPAVLPGRGSDSTAGSLCISPTDAVPLHR